MIPNSRSLKKATYSSNRHCYFLQLTSLNSSIFALGLLHVGDIIKEINGQDVDDPDQLTEMMKKSSGSVTLKVLPSYYDTGNFSQVSGRGGGMSGGKGIREGKEKRGGEEGKRNRGRRERKCGAFWSAFVLL